MNVDVSPSPFQGGVNDMTGLSGLATADGSGLTRYTSVCRVNLGDPVIVSERDREQSALGPDLLKYERKELLRASKRIKTKSASRAKQLALRTRAAAAAAAKQQQPSGSNSNSTTAAVAQSSTVAKSSQHSKRTSGARMQHARMLERYGDLTRLSLETQSRLEDSDGKIQRLLKRRSALSEQRVQIDKEVTALQRRIREMVAATMEAAAAATGGGPTAAQPPTTESEESQETASSSSSTPPQEPEAATAAAAAPKPTHHVTANPHLNRARARLGRLAKRWQPTEDRDNKLEEDREEAERLLSQRQPSPKRKVRPPEISIEMASANVDDEGDGDEGGGGVEARESEEEDMEIMTEGDESEGEEDAVMDDATEADSGEEGSNGSSSSHHHDDDH
ncbi:hypothetical protein FOZ60_008558 [Perkinsus olseni]|uniref:Uncharacterized protein n=1 Tax=Perkinsus olseni TaxID=32597 RepID=A0A7J6NIU8_PEROL|nr:hypothetical protein FOZ60_008558 [Perkinsus olseni]